MKLGINGWRVHGSRTGVGRYIVNVTRHWTEEVINGRFDPVTFYSQRPIDRADIPLPAAIRTRTLRSRLPMIPWENVRLAPVAVDDLLYHPSFSIPLYRRGRSVVVTHDAAHELFPHLFPRSVRLFYRYLYRYSARRATLVIAGGHACRDDVIATLGLSPDKVRAVQMGPAERFRHRPETAVMTAVQQQVVGDEAPFFLFVGKLAGRRSVPLLLEGFAQFKRETGLPHRLVAVGLNTRNVDVVQMLRRLNIAEDVIYPGYVDDDTLNALYHLAYAHVSPAIYESVCLPVFEAQAAGRAVICVDTPGMRETTGGHALLLASPDNDHMAAAFTRLAREPELRASLGEQAREYSLNFSWERCARETLDVLAEAATM